MNKDISILVVEDDEDINGVLRKILSREGYDVKSAFSGTEAKLYLDMHDFHLIILDLMLPGMTGEELISYIRSNKSMPVIVVSAKTSQDDKIKLLKLGADDFVSKPFDINEVLARVQAQIRRYIEFSHIEEVKEILKYKELTLDRDLIEVRINGEIISLTVKEFAILELLLTYPKKVFTRANLFEKVWDDDFLGDDKTINVHISNIRSKISAIDKDNEYIKTVWGIGFKLGE